MTWHSAHSIVLQRLAALLVGTWLASAVIADESALRVGPALKGAWLNDAMPGQGFLVEVIESPDVLFIAWFTFPRDSEDAATRGDRHRWFTLEGAYASDGSVETTLYETSGGAFLGPAPVDQAGIGSATVRFVDCNSAVIDYRFNDSGESGQINLRRAVPVEPLTCLALLPPQALPESIEPDRPAVFLGATVLDLPAVQWVDEQMVVIEGGVITWVGPLDAQRIPADAALVDARGRFLTPGLVDTHTHLATNVREFQGLNAPANVIEQSARNQLMLYLARGVTTLLNNGDFGEDLPRWDEETRSGEKTGPTVYAAKYARGDAGTPDGGPTGQEVLNATQARAFTRAAHEAGYRFMKVYNHTPREGVLAILDEGAKLDMPVIGHFPQTLSTQEVLDAGMTMVAHSGAYLWQTFNNNPNVSPSQIQQAINLTLSTGTHVTATVGLEELVAQVFCNDPAGVAAYWARPVTRYMHPTTVSLNDRSITAAWRWNPPGCIHESYERWLGFIQEFTLGLHEAGVPLLMGTDSPTVLGVPGFSAVDEVQALVNTGIDLPDAVRIATWNGGRYITEALGLDTPFGAVRAGWRADLLLLDQDPLVAAENLASVAGVMARGEWHSTAWFEVQLEAIAQSYGN